MTTGRIAFLDGIRGVAAMTVVLYHALQVWLDLADPWAHWLWTGPLAFLTDGEAAVLLFFVLSGVALSWSPLQGGTDPFLGSRSTLVWLLARSLRIYGPYGVTLVLMAAARRILWDPASSTPPPSSWFRHFSSIEASREQVLHDLMLPWHHPGLVAQGWSLTEEMRFAVLLPLLLPAMRFGSGATVLCLILAAWWAGLSAYVVFFSAGLLMAKHWWEIERRISRLSRQSSFLLLAVGLALYSVARWGPWHFPILTRTLEVVAPLNGWVAAGAAVLLVAPLGMPGWRAMLESVPLQWLGRISFSLYLVHLLPVFYLSPRIARQLNALGLTGSFTVTAVSVAGVCFVSLPLAFLFHRWVETPSAAGARWMIRRWGHP